MSPRLLPHPTPYLFPAPGWAHRAILSCPVRLGSFQRKKIIPGCCGYLYPISLRPKALLLQPWNLKGKEILKENGILHWFGGVVIYPFQYYNISSVQFSSVTQSCPTLCNPMNHSTPGLPVQHQLPEFIQTQVHQVGDAIQPSHPLSSPSPPAPNPSQHQGLFQWVNSSHEVAKVLGVSASASVLPVNTQDWSPLG